MKRLIVILALLFCAPFSVPTHAQPLGTRQDNITGWRGEAQGQFVTALCTDSNGDLWVGTEGNGLWRRSNAGQWQQFGLKNGLSDDSILSLALDTHHRLWVGTSRGGVCVWNGQGWRSFDVSDGPLSEHISSIAIAPKSGEVWLGTDAGIARYSDEAGWRYLTHLDGLASNQIRALAFAPSGDVYVATACEGLSIGRSADGYSKWKTINGATTQPTAAQGEGLPSNVLNDVAVDSEGGVWVATYYGLAKSIDGGATWSFLRGKDWANNVEGSTAGLKPQNGAADVDLLAEDEVLSLAPTPDGRLWIGFNRKGYELREAKDGELVYSQFDNEADTPNTDRVRALCPIRNGALLGIFGHGIQVAGNGTNQRPAIETLEEDPQPQMATLPQVASVPSQQDLRDLYLRLSRFPPLPDATKGGFYGTDWRTQGDWVGRYGDRAARLYGMGGAPLWHDVVREPQAFQMMGASSGPHRGPAAGPYYYCADLETNDPRALYTPVKGVRRQAEINDGTWQDDKYPPSWEGPDLWLTFRVPEGTHRAALYFRNDTGHGRGTRFRDYIVQLKRGGSSIADTDNAPDLARARVSDFWNGLYVQFWLNGGGEYRIKIARGRSQGTVLSGLFLDQIDGFSRPENTQPMPSMGGVRYITEPSPPPIASENETLAEARMLWDKCPTSAGNVGIIEGSWQARLMAYRSAVANGATPELLANWRWKLSIWNEADRSGFAQTMHTAFQEEDRRQQTKAITTEEPQ